MLRSCLQLLLLVCLVLNGVSASMACAHRGDNGAQAATEVSVHDADMHAHHAMDADAAHVTHAATEADHGDCGGSGCQCGCVLPPAVATVAHMAAVTPVAGEPAARAAVRRVVQHGTPPFRPPAVA